MKHKDAAPAALLADALKDTLRKALQAGIVVGLAAIAILALLL